MELLWDIGIYKTKMIECSKNETLFVKFVNLLMNDTTYLLDESLAKLTKIRDIEKSMENHAVWMSKPQQERQVCMDVVKKKFRMFSESFFFFDFYTKKYMIRLYSFVQMYVCMY